MRTQKEAGTKRKQITNSNSKHKAATQKPWGNDSWRARALTLCPLWPWQSGRHPAPQEGPKSSPISNTQSLEGPCPPSRQWGSLAGGQQQLSLVIRESSGELIRRGASLSWYMHPGGMFFHAPAHSFPRWGLASASLYCPEPQYCARNRSLLSEQPRNSAQVFAVLRYVLVCSELF